jgi:hypothetical protein
VHYIRLRPSLKAPPVASHQQALYNDIREINVMDNKYLKIAFILVFASFMMVTIVFLSILLLTRS